MRTARPEPSGFAAKAKDLQALRDAVDQAATVSGALWLSYIFVFLYLAIAAGAVTHKDLFFENPVKLPFLNVELPLIGFFALGPALFLIVHWYTLLHFALLAGKVGAFRSELEAQVGLHSDREDLRRQLPSNIFVQFLAGPRDVRSGLLGAMLRLIAWMSLILGPIALLIFFQLQFLPYHDPWVTWWQRVAVFFDLLLLWVLWPRIAPITTGSRLRRFSLISLRAASLMALSIPSLLLVFTIATFPGEFLHEIVPTIRFIPWSWVTLPSVPRYSRMIQTLSLHEILFAGPVNDITRRPRSFWSNRIVLPEINILDELKLDETKLSSTRVTISLRGRNLNGVVLVSARLPKADFTGASLREANLSGADLREAVFECGGYRRCVDLRGASLHGAKLQGADLLDAQLQGSDLNGAILQGAVLGGANLFGSELWFAHLQGAFLMRANLQGLYLGNAYLEGAILSETQLQGAVLESANLKAAFLDKTQLQGAFFVKSFGDVTGPQFEGAFLDHVFVWRTDPTLGRFDNTLI